MNRDIKALDEALTHLFKEKGFPGIAVTIRGPEGILFEKGYGGSISATSPSGR